jgi:hypothetical protein
MFLNQGMRIVSAAGKNGVHARRWVMWLWVVAYAFVGSQMAWTLRPFIGAPSIKFELFRQLGGNFHSNIFTSIGGILGFFAVRQRVGGNNDRPTPRRCPTGNWTETINHRSDSGPAPRCPGRETADKAKRSFLAQLSCEPYAAARASSGNRDTVRLARASAFGKAFCTAPSATAPSIPAGTQARA